MFGHQHVGQNTNAAKRESRKRDRLNNRAREASFETLAPEFVRNRIISAPFSGSAGHAAPLILAPFIASLQTLEQDEEEHDADVRH